MLETMKKKTMSFGDPPEEHEIGNKKCDMCWGDEYPKKCECGGLIHAEFGDEDKDDNYWLYVKCDKCGEEDIEE